MKMENEKLVVMTEDELDNLIYYACRRAANNVSATSFHGYVKAYFGRWDEDIRTIIAELDQIKLKLDDKENKLDTKKVNNKESREDNTLSDNPKLKRLLEAMTDEEKQEFGKHIKSKKKWS